MAYYYQSFETFAEEKKVLTDIELLEKYKPITYISKSEKYNLVNAIDYFQYDKINYDNSIMCSILKTNNKTYLYYFYCFEEDGGKRILGLTTINSHKDDIECVIVELTDEKISGLCYMPHSSVEHFWIRDENDLKLIIKNSTHPLAYISNDKHSIYPISGPVYRYFFFGNDSCINPIERDTNLIMINKYLLNKNSIGEGMVGFGRRIKKSTSEIAVIRLSDLKYRKIFG